MWAGAGAGLRPARGEPYGAHAREGVLIELATVFWVALAFGLSVCWAATVLVNKRVLDRVTPLGVNFFVRIVAMVAEVVVIAGLTVVHLWPYGFGLNWAAAGWIALNGLVAWGIAFNAYYYALRGGRVGVVAPIIGTDPLWTALFATLLIGSTLGPATITGLAVAMAGVALLSRWSGPVPEGSPDVPAAAPAAGASRAALMVIVLAVVTAAGWGLNPVLIELGENAYGGPSAAMVVESQALGIVLLGAIIWARRSPLVSRRLTPAERRAVVWLIVAAGVLEAIFAVGFYLVIAGIGSVLTTLIIASSPVFSIAGGLLFFKERLGWKLGLAAGVTLAGVLVATAARLV